MQESQLLTLIRALKEVDLAAERINRERKEIVRRIETAERQRKRCANRGNYGKGIPPKTRLGAPKAKLGVPKARFVAGASHRKESVPKPREFLCGDRIYITNRVQSTSGHKAPSEADRHATVRYQQGGRRDKVQVYFVTDSGVSTYRLSTNVIHIGPNYSSYESARSCNIAKRSPLDAWKTLKTLCQANQLA